MEAREIIKIIKQKMYKANNYDYFIKTILATQQALILTTQAVTTYCMSFAH